MELDKLLAFFSGSPAIRLLRSLHAPFVIHFLFLNFKQGGGITLSHSELASRLADYQEQLWQTHADVLRDRPDTYLTAWCSGDTRWLRRFLEADQNEASYELTAHTEDVLRFLQDMLDKTIGFVGTESRLRRIIQTLSDLVVGSSDDPAQRLEHLEAERERIDAEIKKIRTEGVVATYTPTAIRERFADVVTDLNQLQSDFRAVEDRFKEITRDVQKRHVQSEGTRGEILGHALDAEERLKTEDQGISFDEFVRLVLSPSKQDELEQVIARLGEIEELVDQADGLSRIRSMVPSLLAEAQKVLRTTQRLSMTLRRLLDARSSASRRRLATTLREIRTLAARLADGPRPPGIAIGVETELQLSSAMERTFWTSPTSFEALELRAESPDDDDRLEAFRSLAAMRRLDWSAMRRRLSSSLRGRESIRLSELLDAHPPEGGVVEVLGYIQIAHDDGHRVDPDQTDSIVVPGDRFDGAGKAWGMRLEIPRVVYLPAARRDRSDRPERNGQEQVRGTSTEASE